MQYQPPIKGRIPKKKPIIPDLNQGVESVVNLVTDLNNLKTELLNTSSEVIITVNEKFQEIDNVIADVEETISSSVQTLQDAKEEVSAAIAEIKNGEQGEQGEPGVNADEQAIFDRLLSEVPKRIDLAEFEKTILAKVPKFNEKSFAKKIFESLPQNKASLKIITESIEIDPMSVIEKIMTLPLGKFKLKTENIEGLEQTMSAFRNQLGRGYLHGGGDTVVAGSGITIDSNPNGTKTINSTGGGGSPGGSNTQVQFNNSGVFGGVADFTWDSGTKTLSILGGGTTPVSFAVEGVYIGSDPNTNIAIVGPASGFSYIDFSVPNVDNDARIIVDHSAVNLAFHIGQSDEGSMSFFAGGGIGMNSNLSVTGTVNGLSLSQANITTTSDNGLTIATGGVSSGTGTGTALILTAGAGGSTSGDGGVLNINGGSVPAEGDGGDINVQLYPGATASATSHRGGNFNVYLSGGVSGGAAGLFRISTPNQGYGGILDFSNLTSDHVFSFPNKDGIVAMLSDVTGGSPGGSNGQIQYNNSGSFGGSSATITSGGTINIPTGQAYNYNGVNVITATTISGNYFFGPAGNLTTSGTNHTAVGAGALVAITSGGNSTAVGQNALHALTTGEANTAMGTNALGAVVAADNNIAFGRSAQQNNVSGSGNAALGRSALFLNTTGFYNTAVGFNALHDLDITANDGSGNNTAIGKSAGLGIVTGVSNTIIGANITVASSSLSNNIIIADGDGVIRLQFINTGKLTLGAYGAGTFTGTPTKALLVDASGNVIEGAISIGTVTAVSIATANGFSGSSTGGATPALTIIAGAITPTSVNGVVLSGSGTPSLAVTGTTAVSGTNTGDQTSVSGNAGTATALQNARTIGGVSFNGTTNITVATATGGFTVSGGDLAIGANNLTITGSVGATGARVTKGWFTDLEMTNLPSVGGTALTTTIAKLNLLTSAAGTTGTTTTNIVFSTSPVLITPNLGTPTTLVGTNISGTAASLTAGAVTNATFTTALTVNGGTLTLTANAANTSVLTIGAGAVSVSGSNTGDNAVNSSTTFVGTTSIALNRASASQALTGITSIDGSAATLTTPRTIGGVSFNGSTNITVSTATAGFTISGGTLTPATGSTTVAPITFASGTNLTSAVAGAEEFDGVQRYSTLDTTSGRGAVPVQQYFHLTATGGNISTIANYFGTTSNISLVASGYYEIEIVLYFLKNTAGTVTWTLTNSAAPTSQNIYYEMSPITGAVALPGTTSTMIVGQEYGNTTAAKAIVTGSLSTAVNHYARFKIFLQNGTGTSLKIQATCSAGTITPGINSYWFARRISPNNIGTFAA